MSPHHPLSTAQIEALEGNGCRAENWSLVVVADGFDPAHVHRVRFVGQVRIGALSGHVEVEGGVRLPAGLADAT
ncbi:MAG: DUF4954 family protein, partial [Candidatus Latescibacterota bacterium]|nr:DUF4954 family protein [Candidatus Latescibacterota bacterium]